jgi:hypothetical protein
LRGASNVAGQFRHLSLNNDCFLAVIQYRAGRKIMSIIIEAIYESGILRPLMPLPELEDKS